MILWGRETRAINVTRLNVVPAPGDFTRTADQFEQNMQTHYRSAGFFGGLFAHKTATTRDFRESIGRIFHIVGTVVLYGTVIEHEKGYRASRAMVDGIWRGIFMPSRADYWQTLALATHLLPYQNCLIPVGPEKEGLARSLLPADQVLEQLSRYYEAPLVPMPEAIRRKLAPS